MRALELLAKKGVIRLIGLSDFPVKLVESARKCLSLFDIDNIQITFIIVELEATKTHIPYAEAEGLSVLAWSPLAKRAVLGKYTLGTILKVSMMYVRMIH